MKNMTKLRSLHYHALQNVGKCPFRKRSGLEFALFLFLNSLGRVTREAEL